MLPSFHRLVNRLFGDFIVLANEFLRIIAVIVFDTRNILTNAVLERFFHANTPYLSLGQLEYYRKPTDLVETFRHS